MYEEYYQLEKTPFSATPDPDFFFTSSGHREALAALIYGIQYRKGFISLVGEVGTGKTTVLRSYIHSRYARNLKLIYVFNPKLDFDNFLTVVLREFTKDIPSTEIQKADLLHRYLVAYYEKNINVVIVVDEAQNTPSETLESMRMLSNIETTKHKLVQIVLAGQPELDALLSSHSLRQLRQRIALTIRLSPLTRDESLAYIGHRILRAGSTKRLFTPAALDWIVERSGGVPRKINMICDNALITGFGADEFPVDVEVLIEIEDDLSSLGIVSEGNSLAANGAGDTNGSDAAVNAKQTLHESTLVEKTSESVYSTDHSIADVTGDIKASKILDEDISEFKQQEVELNNTDLQDLGINPVRIVSNVELEDRGGIDGSVSQESLRIFEKRLDEQTRKPSDESLPTDMSGTSAQKGDQYSFELNSDLANLGSEKIVERDRDNSSDPEDIFFTKMSMVDQGVEKKTNTSVEHDVVNEREDDLEASADPVSVIRERKLFKVPRRNRKYRKFW